MSYIGSMSYLGPSLILTAVLHAYVQEIAQTIAVQRKLLLLASNCKFPAHKNSVNLLFGSWIIAQRVTTSYIAPLSFLGKLKALEEKYHCSRSCRKSNSSSTS